MKRKTVCLGDGLEGRDDRYRLSLRKMGMLILTLVSLTACQSCSRIDVETTPWGEKVYRVDSRENATRVNAWPLFYHMGENTSVLWPLYQQSEKGNQVFPLYSYRKEPRWLDVALGVLSELDFKNEDYRVFNVGWDKKDKEEFVFPLFYHRHKDPDKPATWITLPYSQGPDFYNVGGVLFHSSKSPARRAMWAAAGMFYNQARVDGSSRTNRLFPFWSWKRSGPADAPDKTHLNVGMVGYVQRTEKEGNLAYRSILFPLTHCWSSDQEKGSAVFPLYYDQKKTNGDHARVTPLSLSYKKGETSWDSIGWLFHFWNLDRSTGHMLLPFYSLATLKGGGHRFNSLLYNEQRSDEKTLTNVGGPLFYASNNKSGDSYRTVLWPFFQQWNSEKSQARTDLLFPFYLYSKKEGSEATLFPIPFGGRWKEGDARGSFLFPLYSAKSSPKESRLYTLPYSYGVELGSKPEQTRHWKSVGSSLVGYFERQGADRKFLSLLGLIGHDSNSEKNTFHTWMFPVFGVSERRFDSLPFSYWNTQPTPAELDKVMAEAKEKKEKNEWYSRYFSKGWRVGIGGYEERLVVRGGPSIKVGASQSPEDSDGVSVTRSSSSNLFPLWKAKRTEGMWAESRVLPFGALWKSETKWIQNQEKTDKQVRSQVLWKVVDYESVGDKASVDTFPFITWDRDAERDYHSFSFIGPIFRKSSVKDRSQWQILGIKFGEDLAEE